MRNTQKAHHKPQSRPRIKVGVSGFGPISKGTVELRPLTVFVGPSNVGKTYLATLIYSLHRILSGFSAPYGDSWVHSYPFYRTPIKAVPSKSDQDELRSFLKALKDYDQDVVWANLPAVMSRTLIRQLTSADLGLHGELFRSFDLTELNDLILSNAPNREASVFVEVRDEVQTDWSLRFKISPDRVSTTTRIRDLVLAPKRELRNIYSHRLYWELKMLERFLSDGGRFGKERFARLMEELLSLMIRLRDYEDTSIHYLPAARSGIMQSHRVIASSLVSRSTRAGVERTTEIPTFSGPLADFMNQLLLFSEKRKPNRALRRIAESLESETLAGRIIGRSNVPDTYPEFVYRPTRSKSDIRLSRASSMVSELAPIVLFLRGVVSANSTVVIEEPEAHLHPAAQAQIAITLGRMVRAGLTVVVTTHSDWLLKGISNLVREGIASSRGDDHHELNSSPQFLQQEEVGVWLFRDSSRGSSIEEIPFDSSEGLEPTEYEDVEERLYNQAAHLQNVLEESGLI